MIHIPTTAKTLQNMKQTQIRLLLQGAPGSGKTYSALTFPNPLVINFDKKLGAHRGRTDVNEIDFCDPAVYGKYAPLRKDAIIKFLLSDGAKLSDEQTLIIDSWTTFQAAYDVEAPVVYSTRTGKEDGQAWWGEKLDYNKQFCGMIKSLKCNVILTVHEQAERNDDGSLSGKLKPLSQGQFADQLSAHFTDVFRQIAIDKPTDLTKVKLEHYKLSAENYKKFVDSFVTPTLFLWQTQPDSVANCLTSIPNVPRYIKAHYEDYIKYNNFSAPL